jgi:pimeloyl-ACP methyl ester carboxylesterase
VLAGFLVPLQAKTEGGSCLSARVIALGDQEVAYYESPGRGETVVMLHGNSMSSYAFQNQLCGSLGKKLHIVAVDLPGHGRSGYAADPAIYTLPGYAAVLTQFVQTLGLDDAVFAGWSLGGHILLEAASGLSSAKGFMIFGTPPLGVPPAFNEAFLAANPAAGLAFQSGWNNDAVERYVGSLFAPGAQDIPDFFYKDARRTDGDSRFQLLMSVGTLNYADEIEIARNITRPLAIIHGEKDQAVSLAYIRGLGLNNLWRGKVHVIKNAGHTPQWESVREFDRLLRAFVRDAAK